MFKEGRFRGGGGSLTVAEPGEVSWVLHQYRTPPTDDPAGRPCMIALFVSVLICRERA
jgi:hypothetical protein